MSLDVDGTLCCWVTSNCNQLFSITIAPPCSPSKALWRTHLARRGGHLEALSADINGDLSSDEGSDSEASAQDANTGAADTAFADAELSTMLLVRKQPGAHRTSQGVDNHLDHADETNASSSSSGGVVGRSGSDEHSALVLRHAAFANHGCEIVCLGMSGEIVVLDALSAAVVHCVGASVRQCAALALPAAPAGCRPLQCALADDDGQVRQSSRCRLILLRTLQCA